jgi:hypothetical protein
MTAQDHLEIACFMFVKAIKHRAERKHGNPLADIRNAVRGIDETVARGDYLELIRRATVLIEKAANREKA